MIRKKLLNLYAEQNALLEVRTGKELRQELVNDALEVLSQAGAASIQSLDGSSLRTFNHNEPDSVIEDCIAKLIP